MTAVSQEQLSSVIASDGTSYSDLITAIKRSGVSLQPVPPAINWRPCGCAGMLPTAAHGAFPGAETPSLGGMGHPTWAQYDIVVGLLATEPSRARSHLG